jgi:hypothetical protein
LAEEAGGCAAGWAISFRRSRRLGEVTEERLHRRIMSDDQRPLATWPTRSDGRLLMCFARAPAVDLT